MLFVGPGVGIAVGAIVGAVVGAAVGVDDGAGVGCTVPSSLVGYGVGAGDGDGDGAAVGHAVGAGVGPMPYGDTESCLCAVGLGGKTTGSCGNFVRVPSQGGAGALAPAAVQTSSPVPGSRAKSWVSIDPTSTRSAPSRTAEERSAKPVENSQRFSPVKARSA